MKHFYKLFSLLLFSLTVWAQQPQTLTVMSYNLLNYRNATSYCPYSQNNPLNKEQYLKTITKYLPPDILVCNEVGSSATSGDFILLNVLNTDGVNYYQKAAHTNNGFSSLVNALFYNTQKVVLKSQQVVTKDLSNNDLVRVIDLYRFYHKDSLLTNQSDTVYFTVVAAHLKAGSSGSDLTDRADAAAALMEFIKTQVDDENVILCGDLNIYKSQEQAYQNLTQGSFMPTRFYDPLNSPGNWASNSTFASLHTQSTRSNATNGGCFSSGGLDDRLDHILITDEVRDNVKGVRYIPNTYWAVGNDGLHYNKAINEGTNNSVPANVLSAIYNLSDHLPLVAEFEMASQQIGLSENQLFATQIHFANPVTEVLELKLASRKATQPQMRIMSITGEVVLTAPLQNEQNYWIASANVSHLKSGVYFIEVSSANGWRAVKKMVKL